jgi:hypothetical protein
MAQELSDISRLCWRSGARREIKSPRHRTETERQCSTTDCRSRACGTPHAVAFYLLHNQLSLPTPGVPWFCGGGATIGVVKSFFFKAHTWSRSAAVEPSEDGG